MHKKNYGKYFAAFCLFFSLMVPTAIQAMHLFDMHEHFSCTDDKSHVHQTPVECEICSVHLSTFHLDLAKEYQYVVREHAEMGSTHPISAIALQDYFNNTQLRAPPYSS